MLALFIVSLVFSSLSFIGTIVMFCILHKAMTKIIGPDLDKMKESIKNIASRT